VEEEDEEGEEEDEDDYDNDVVDVVYEYGLEWIGNSNI